MPWSRWLLAVIVVTVASLSGGCLKDDNQVYQVAAVRALNAMPGSEVLDVFLDNSKLNFDNMAGEDEPFAYTDTIPYKNAWPNNRVVSVVDPDDYPDARPLLQQTVNFIPGKFYSLYIVGHDVMELLRVEDDLTPPEDGQAKVRFIHLAPDAPALDVEVSTGEEESFTVEDKPFKAYSGFMPVGSGSDYTVSFIDHRTGEVLHTFEFFPENGGIYTVWIKGLLHNGATDATLDFGHGIVVH